MLFLLLQATSIFYLLGSQVQGVAVAGGYRLCLSFCFCP